MNAVVALLLAAVLGVSPGDILVTRNLYDNSSPGFWNHAAICVGDTVVESQEGLGVIATPLDVFMARYPVVAVMRPRGAYPRSVNAAVNGAMRFVGQPYKRVASVFRLRPYWIGENCTSLARKAHALGYGVDPGCRADDAVLRKTATLTNRTGDES
jgi:uncharacterized protein YycO